MKKRILIYMLALFYILSLFLNPIMAKWSEPIVISSESENSAYRAIQGIDVDDNLHIAWKDNSNYSGAGEDWDIFYKFKPKNGNWTKTEIVSFESTNDSNCLFMSVDKNKTVHVVWKDKTDINDAGSDYDTFYKYKQFNKNWSKIKLVSVNSNVDTGCPCSTIDNKEILHVVWSDGIDEEKSANDWDVYYSKLKNDGNFSSIELISSESISNSFEPVIDIDSKNNIHILWYEKSDFDNSGNDYDIFYRYKLMDSNWSNTSVVSKESTSSSTIPALTLDSEDIIHIVWVDATNINDAGSDGDIFYKNKTLNTDWSKATVVSKESNTFSHWPSITSDKNDTIHIVWKDKIITDNIRTYSDIFYKYKTKKGVWSDLELVSNNSTNESNWGSVVTDSENKIHVSWWDDFDGRWVMYFSNRTAADISIINNIDDSTNIKEDYSLFILTSIFIIAFIVVYLVYKKYKK